MQTRWNSTYGHLISPDEWRQGKSFSFCSKATDVKDGVWSKVHHRHTREQQCPSGHCPPRAHESRGECKMQTLPLWDARTNSPLPLIFNNAWWLTFGFLSSDQLYNSEICGLGCPLRWSFQHIHFRTLNFGGLRSNSVKMKNFSMWPF